MPRSIVAHLSLNFYRSCQADYRHAQYRSPATLSRPHVAQNFRTGSSVNHP